MDQDMIHSRPRDPLRERRVERPGPTIGLFLPRLARHTTLPPPAAFEADQAIGSQFTEQPPDHLAVQSREHLLEFRHRTAPR